MHAFGAFRSYSRVKQTGAAITCATSDAANNNAACAYMRAFVDFIRSRCLQIAPFCWRANLRTLTADQTSSIRRRSPHFLFHVTYRCRCNSLRCCFYEQDVAFSQTIYSILGCLTYGTVCVRCVFMGFNVSTRSRASQVHCANRQEIISGTSKHIRRWVDERHTSPASVKLTVRETWPYSGTLPWVRNVPTATGWERATTDFVHFLIR